MVSVIESLRMYPHIFSYRVTKNYYIGLIFDKVTLETFINQIWGHKKHVEENYKFFC